MTPKLAQELIAWLDNARFYTLYRAPGQQFGGVKVTLLPDVPSPGLRALLASKLAATDWHVTPHGLGIEGPALRYLHERAKRVPPVATPEATPHPAQAAPTRKVRPTIELERVPPKNIPPGFVAWEVVDLRQISEVLRQISDTTQPRVQLAQSLRDRVEHLLPITTLWHVERLRALVEEFPNFSDVIDTLCRGLQLDAHLKRPLKLPPTVLLGAPGLGKTVFCKRVAEVLGMWMEDRSLAELTAGFLLTGSSHTWSQGQAGVVAKLIAGTPDRKAPLLLLDELDKARSDGSYATDRALLGLLEGHSAARFRDENLEVVLDAEPVSLMFTANRIGHVRPEILSRLSIAHVRAPTAAERPAIVRSIDRTLRHQVPAYALAFEALEDAVVHALTTSEPRQMRKHLLDGYARAAQRRFGAGGKIALIPDDLLPEGPPASRIAAKPDPNPWTLLVIDPEALRRSH